MKCEITNRDQIVDDYLAGTLSDEEAAAFRDHCFDCDLCFNELRFRKGLAELIKAKAKVDFAKDRAKPREIQKGFIHSLIEKWLRFMQQVNRPWIYATAGAMAVLVLLFLVSQNRMPPTDNKDLAGRKPPVTRESPNEAQPDSIEISKNEKPIESTRPDPKKETQMFGKRIKDEAPEPHFDKTELLAANFETSPYFETLITTVSRSYAIKILSPNNNANFNRDILFKWKPIDEGTLDLIIVNNKGDELFTLTPVDNRYIFKQKLEPGLYYWKLETSDDLLYVGKFFVGKQQE